METEGKHKNDKRTKNWIVIIRLLENDDKCKKLNDNLSFYEDDIKVNIKYHTPN